MTAGRVTTDYVRSDGSIMQRRCVRVGGVELELRPPPSTPLIYSSWLRSARVLSQGDGSAERWFASQRLVVEDLMPLVVCAVPACAPNTVHGWVCGELGLLHWAYVPAEDGDRPSLRRLGLGRALVEAVCGAQGIASHRRPKAHAGFAPGFGYDPFALLDAVRRATASRLRGAA